MKFNRDVFAISSQEEFKSITLELFAFQFENNPVYRSFCDLLYKHPADINTIEEIPFLPISFFKSKQIVSGTDRVEKTFTSSGTTGSVTSKHDVLDLELYHKSYSKGFKHFYGGIQDYAILGLLPSYLEREGSSLIYMVEGLIKTSKHPQSGFYLYNHEDLGLTLKELESNQTPTLLIGVSFALLDFIEKYPQKLQHTIVMETGGMKGRRKELIREDLHQLLQKGFGVEAIHSEYGMTELLSQAYSKGQGIFKCPPWMKVLTRETEDPFHILGTNKTGGLNIIDLANSNSCSFIATQDLGRVEANGDFQVIGRFDHSDIRGCNLMAL